MFKHLQTELSQYVVNEAVLSANSEAVFTASTDGVSEQSITVEAHSWSAGYLIIGTSVASAHEIGVVVLSTDPDELLFRSLKQEWQRERNTLSSRASDNLRSTAYLRLIGMGMKAVPMILNELRSELTTGEPDDWFIALSAITGVNPVALEERGQLQKMAQAWLNWGSQEGHVGAKLVGVSVSANWNVGSPQSAHTAGWTSR